MIRLGFSLVHTRNLMQPYLVMVTGSSYDTQVCIDHILEPDASSRCDIPHGYRRDPVVN